MQAPPDPVSAQTAQGETDTRVGLALWDYQRALEAGQPPDRAAFLEQHADIASQLVEALDGLEFLQQAKGQLSAGPPPSIDLTPADRLLLGDYQLLRELGRGGMAVVYEAHQVSLDRRVALKVLPYAAALDERHLKQFRTEALAAARLRHPHIVTVHAVGSDRGVHYYAMELIDGFSLFQLLQDLRRQEGKPGIEQPAGPTAETRSGLVITSSPVGRIQSPAHYRRIVQFMIQAAEALDHAHGQGIVHRDIKPGNLLIDKRGQLFVADFGLAHISREDSLSLPNTAVGTLRYMSPEQAAGEIVDGRTDVYALGATLYELLTLEPVFPGPSRELLNRQISQQEPRPPRLLNPAIPPELETIVLKALAKLPEERYATAQELSDDLQRYVDDKPILARRPTAWRHAKKWARRHRVLLRVCLATLIIGVSLVQATNTYFLRRAHEAERQAHLRAQKREALAKEAVEELMGLADAILQHLPRMEAARRDMLLKALRLVEQMAEDDQVSEGVLFKRGQAYFRLARVYRNLGQHEVEERQMRNAIAIFEKVAAKYPDQHNYRFHLALAYQNLTYPLSRKREHEFNIEASQKALLILNALSQAHPEIRIYGDARVDQYASLASNLAVAGRFADAEKMHHQGVALAEKRLQDFPGELRYHRNLATHLSRLADLLSEQERAAEALDHYRRAAAEDEKSLPAYPDDAVVMREGMQRWRTLAAQLMKNGQPAEAEPIYRRVLARAQELAERYPLSPGTRLDHALARISLGQVIYDLKRPTKETETLFQAAERQLVELIPEAADRADDVRNILAWHYATFPVHSLRKPKEAVRLVREALTRPLVDAPNCSLVLGAALVSTGDPEDVKEGIKLLEGLKSQPYWYTTGYFLAMAYARQGDSVKAREVYKEMDRWHNRPIHAADELRRFRREAKAVLGIDAADD